jgi:hypothetical protein
VRRIKQKTSTHIMSWLAPLKTAGVLALSALQLLARLLYVLSTPLRWPLYYVYASVVFLLSPLTAMFRFGFGALSFAIDLIVRLKVCYLCANACIERGSV